MAAKRKSIATRWFINSFGIIAIIMLAVTVGVYFFTQALDEVEAVDATLRYWLP